jgi:DNA-binding MarR family transcriptional regulator
MGRRGSARLAVTRPTPAVRQPQWLDTDQQTSWRSLAILMGTVPAALDVQLQRDAGLNYFEYAILSTLSEQAEKPLLVGQLAKVTNASVSRISHNLRRLEGHGLVRREVDPTNRRNTYAILTGAGLEKVRAAAPGHVEEVRRTVIEPLSPGELKQLGAFCERILAGLRHADDVDTGASNHP